MDPFLSPLTPEEEKECISAVLAKDAYAYERLILHNMRLVAHVVKRYINTEEEPEELLSIGTIGLLKAAKSYKLDFGSRFATYAIRCIDNEILMWFRSRKRLKTEVSIYEPIGCDKEGNQIQILDVLECECVDVCAKLEMQSQLSKLFLHLEELLTPTEFYIIKSRYGLYGQQEKTQKEIASTLHISRSYVSRIEKRALEKLRKFML